MSYDLAFWYEEKAINAEAAYQKYAAMTDGESGIVTEHPGVAEFCRDALQAYPDLSEENAEESPWSSPVYCTGECVLVAVSWSRKDEVSTSLIAMAQNRGLVTYDPQKEEVIQRG
ncbi:hypothetical protein OH768_17730 [Streptomyces sp. NBC_01622]|uniref:hypothetical protein n=1 Tax=Streptomyces sp. NBC_01622 TaxID=2975903 RepID=UPI003868D89C|nr:hypothetical protein OH768_17730 [Streptomyces sp. NBC_01622]